MRQAGMGLRPTKAAWNLFRQAPFYIPMQSYLPMNYAPEAPYRPIPRRIPLIAYPDSLSLPLGENTGQENMHLPCSAYAFTMSVDGTNGF